VRVNASGALLKNDRDAFSRPYKFSPKDTVIKYEQQISFFKNKYFLNVLQIITFLRILLIGVDKKNCFFAAKYIFGPLAGVTVLHRLHLTH